MSPQFNVLIVDDVVDNIKVAMNILKEDNYILSFAQDGVEAIELVENRSSNFDLILLDVMMPKKNGFEVCEVLKKNPQTAQIPIIFITAKVDIDSISKGFALGGVDYITKPFHPDELLARVKNHLELSQAKRLLQQNNINLEIKAQHSQIRFLSELEQTQREMIDVLIELMADQSDETGKHIRRISEISALLAHYLPTLSEEDSDILRHASPMHDIGKLTIPHELLHKEGKYDEAEFQEMQSHTTNAYNLLRNSERKLMKAAAIIAHEHHEKWNGKGYPKGLKGHDIHIYGRIVALADVLDALTHERCYKSAWSTEETKQYIVEHRGTQFDPELVDILIEHYDEFAEICTAS